MVSGTRMWMCRSLSILVIVLLAVLSAACDAAESRSKLVLVNDGKPVCSIVIAKDATRSAQFAAYELQYHIEKITGAKAPIVDDESTIKGTCILVGDSKLTAGFGLDGRGLGKQEYIVQFRRNTIVLMGRDKEDYGKVDYESDISLGCSAGQCVSTGTFPSFFEDHGTCYAVYDFLEKSCGVRWYLPTELGIAFTPRKTLTVSGPNIRRAPAMKYRWLTLIPTPEDLCGDTAGNGATPVLPWREDLLWLHRSRAGGDDYDCNHSLDGYFDRFLKTHPGWFAQGYEDATPSSVEPIISDKVFAEVYGNRPPNLCYTNPEVIAQVVRDARDYFDGKGLRPGAIARGDYFAVVPMDGGGWCKCARCQEALKNGNSNYLFSFVNAVAKEVRKSHPDKFISALAYSNYIDPPTKVKLEPNVSIQLCLHTRAVADDLAVDREKRAIMGWSAESKDRQKFIWAYFCFPSLYAKEENRRCFPGFFAHYIPAKMAAYHKAGAHGIYVEPAYLAYGMRSVLLDQVEWYVLMRLADDPELDGAKLINEFFDRYYGAAADPMRKLYTRIEATYANKENYAPDVKPGFSALQTEETAWKYLGNETRMAEFGKLMEQAKQVAQTDTDKQRVALFEKGIWKYMQAGRASYLEHQSEEKR